MCRHSLVFTVAHIQGSTVSLQRHVAYRTARCRHAAAIKASKRPSDLRSASCRFMSKLPKSAKLKTGQHFMYGIIVSAVVVVLPCRRKLSAKEMKTRLRQTAALLTNPSAGVVRKGRSARGLRAKEFLPGRASNMSPHDGYGVWWTAKEN